MRTCDRCGKPAVATVEVRINGNDSMPIPTTDLCPDCKSAYIQQLAEIRLHFKKPDHDDDPVRQAIFDLVFLSGISSRMFDSSTHSDACRGAQKRLLNFVGYETHFTTVGNHSGYGIKIGDVAHE